MTTNTKPRTEGTPSSVDLSAVFSSLEIAANKHSFSTPSTTLPIDEEQSQVLINALRSSLNLGTNVDDILFKEMAEAMMRCKLRCISQEKDEVINNLNHMHIQDENKCQVNCGAYKEQTTKAAACPSIYESVAFTIPIPDSPWPPTAQKSCSESLTDKSDSVKESTTETQSNTKPFSAAACPSIYKSVACTIAVPDSPWPPTAQKACSESLTDKSDSVKESTTETQSNTKPFSAAACPSIYDSVAFTIPPPDSPWPPTAEKAYSESLTDRSDSVEESTSEKQYKSKPFSAQKASPTASIPYTPAPNSTEENLGSCFNNFMAPVFPSSTAPYTPLPNAKEFQSALLHAQQGIGDDVVQNVKTPTFLFKSSSDAGDANTKTNPDESVMVRNKTIEESAVRTVRFQNGTKCGPSTNTKTGKLRRKCVTPCKVNGKTPPPPFVKPISGSPSPTLHEESIASISQPLSSQQTSTIPLVASQSSLCFNVGPGSPKKRNQNIKKPTKGNLNIQQQNIPIQGVRQDDPNKVPENFTPSIGTNNAHSSVPQQPSFHCSSSIPLQPPAQTASFTSTPSPAQGSNLYSPMSLCSPGSTPGIQCDTSGANKTNSALNGTCLFSVGPGSQSSRKVRTGRRILKLSPSVNIAKQDYDGTTSANDNKVCDASKDFFHLPYLARVEYLREEARKHYSSCQYKAAIIKYSEAIVAVSKSSHAKPIEAQANNCPTHLLEKERELLSLLYANRAASLLMVGAYEAATHDCKKATKFVDVRKTTTDSGRVFVAKLYCRMARSYLKLGNVKEAEANFNLAVLISETFIKQLDTDKIYSSELSVLQQLNRIIADATTGLGDAHKCKEAMNIARTLGSIDDILENCPGLESFHEQKINLLIKKRRWSDVSLHCEKMACDAVRLDGVFTEDLHPFNPFPGVEEANYLKADHFTNVKTCERKLSSKAVAEAVLRLPNSLLQSYLRALRLEERYTEAARACTALEDLSNSSSPRLRLKQGGRPVFSWLVLERDKIRRTVATKDRGDANFKNGDYRLAAINYTHCLGIDSDIGSMPNNTAGGRLHAVLFCNRAACYMALRKYRDASNDCTSALAIQSNYLKAILRRARCFARLERYQESLADFTRWMAAVERAKSDPEAHTGIFDTASDILPKEIELVGKEMEDVKLAVQGYFERESYKNRHNRSNGGSSQFSGMPQNSGAHRNRSTKTYGTENGLGGNYKFYAGGVRDESHQRKGSAEKVPPTSESACHYAVLQVSKTCSMVDIKKAYRKLALKYHPDKNSDPEAAAVFRRINTAYGVLSDLSAKRDYDSSLRDRVYMNKF